MKCPSIVDVRDIIKDGPGELGALVKLIGDIKQWVPARPSYSIDCIQTRLHATWACSFTGRADAVTWPGQ